MIDMELYGTALAVFAAVAASLLLLAVLSLRPSTPADDQPSRPRFGPLTVPLAGSLPQTERGRGALSRDLRLAGYHEPADPDNFQAMRALVSWVPSLGGLVLALFASDWRLIAGVAGAGMLLGVLGYLVPRMVVAIQARDRGDRIIRGLPVAMHTMSLHLSAGEPLLEAVQRTGNVLRRGMPDVAAEMRLIHKQAELRSLEHALDRFRERVPVPEAGSFAFLLAQSDRLGTDVTRGLHELAESYRVTARQRAEASANRIAVYMLFPTVFLLLGAAAIVLVAPIFLQMEIEMEKIQREMNESRQQLFRGVQSPTTPEAPASPDALPRPGL